ncbi:SHOCT domain-containing protein [Cohnella sp. JJ-181]|uniref:SHOCT domain-containing protein n=1 Tax=Cohnella rhizoplanae TaxID=2974897 RepID=UPI0022FF818F|nr:SHOCT domain-containing protein [Cohnella sp. JJ-181]CAI6063310.1 hypothetical protein COHCIP112018_01972 [Cohnella sp. JJ-181]
MTHPKKHKKLAVTSLALAIAVFGSAISVGSAFAATTGAAASTATASPAAAGSSATPSASAEDKAGGHHRGGGFRAGWDSAELAKLLGLTEDELKTQLKAGKTLADIASAQGVEAQKVQALIQSALTEQLDSRLADGKITQAQYDAQKATLADRAADAMTGAYSGKGGGKGGHGGGFGGGGRGGFGIDLKDNADIATLFGLTTDELSTQLRAGKSLSALAEAKGVSVDTVTAKVVTLLTAALDQRLADGRITQAQYDAQKAKLADQADHIVSRTFTGHDGARGKGGKAKADEGNDADASTDSSASASASTAD